MKSILDVGTDGSYTDVWYLFGGKIAIAKAVDIARYLLLLAGEEPEAELLTPLRLQKLLYYVQGWTLATRGQPMFDETIQAWVHGPVAPSVYKEFARFGNRSVELDGSADLDSLSEADRAIVRSVWEYYGQFSASALRHMTHSERPWMEARGSAGPDDRTDMSISNESMRLFFEDLYERKRVTDITMDDVRMAEVDFQAGRGVSFDDVLKQLRDAV